MTIIEHDIAIDIQIGGNKWIPTDMDVSRSRYNETDTARMMVIPDPEQEGDIVPVEGTEIIIRLGPRTSFIENAGRSKSDDPDELYRVFTGYVSNSFQMQKGLWEVDAVDFILDLKKIKLNFSTGDGETVVSSLVQEIVDKVNSEKDSSIIPDLEADINIENPEENVSLGYVDIVQKTRANVPRNATKEGLEISRQYTQVKCADVLDDLAKAVNVNWWVDAFNVLRFGPTETSIHRLDWVTETSAGKQTPPYRSVRVVGDGISSESGREAKKLISKDGVISVGSVEAGGQPYGGYDGTTADLQRIGFTEEEIAAVQQASSTDQELKEPIFTYKNKSIKTKEEAQRIRNKILNELQEQQAGGSITIVGRPMVDILDVVEMPKRFGQTSQGEFIEPAQYLVGKVSHRLNGSDGYVTKVECAGIAGRYSGPVFEYQDGEIVLSSEEGEYSVEQ